MNSEDEILAVVAASPARRFIGIASLWFLAALLIYIAIVEPPETGWQIFLILISAGSVWLAELMRRATAFALELTREELRCSNGERLALVSEIRSMDRGMFAFKPSNGFLLTTNVSGPRTWRPGLWWRVGKRIGIGGMTPGSQTKTMAEFISAMVLEHQDSD